MIVMVTFGDKFMEVTVGDDGDSDPDGDAAGTDGSDAGDFGVGGDVNKSPKRRCREPARSEADLTAAKARSIRDASCRSPSTVPCP